MLGFSLVYGCRRCNYIGPIATRNRNNTMARYIIETKQRDGRVWMSSGGRTLRDTARGVFADTATSKSAAVTLADRTHAACHAPKRVIDTRTGEVVYTVGDTAEHEAHLQRIDLRIRVRDGVSAAVERLGEATIDAFIGMTNAGRDSALRRAKAHGLEN